MKMNMLRPQAMYGQLTNTGLSKGSQTLNDSIYVTFRNRKSTSMVLEVWAVFALGKVLAGRGFRHVGDVVS